MQPNQLKLLEDMLTASELIAQFVQGVTFDQYLEDIKLRSAVERQFEILGEALTQLKVMAPEAAVSIPHHRRIISFRNVLIHGYSIVDQEIVWNTATADIPPLIEYLLIRLETQ